MLTRFVTCPYAFLLFIYFLFQSEMADDDDDINVIEDDSEVCRGFEDWTIFNHL